jgi:flagellin
MVVSVNTNAGSMLALQALRKTSGQLAQSTLRITTGLKVNGPEDDPATFAIAQNLRGDIAAVTAVKTTLSLGKSTVDVAIDGATAVSDLLTEMKAKAIQASQSGLDSATQGSLQQEFTALRSQIVTVVGTADFNNKNLIESGASNLNILSSVDGSVIVVSAQSMDIITLTIHTAALTNASQAGTAVTAISNAIVTVTTALSSLGSAAKRVEITQNFIGKMVDVLKEGVGNLVDADLAEETALLEALQIKEQLGVQALSIANGAPQAILNLFLATNRRQ